MTNLQKATRDFKKATKLANNGDYSKLAAAILQLKHARSEK